MSKTSWQVKQKYNNKVYSTIGVALKKDLVAKFKEKCKEEGIAQAEVIRRAIEEFLDD